MKLCHFVLLFLRYEGSTKVIGETVVQGQQSQAACRSILGKDTDPKLSSMFPQ